MTVTDDDTDTETSSDEQELSREEKLREMQGGEGSPGGMGGGNPMAQMMGGGAGGPPGMGAGGADQGGIGGEELVREVEQLREEVHDIRRTLERIADELE